MNKEFLNRYTERIENIPAPGGGCHVSLLGVANLGIMAGLKPETIFNDIRRAIPRGNRRVTDREIWDAVEKAKFDCSLSILLPDGEVYRRYRPPAAAPVVKDGKAALRRIIEKATIREEADLWEASPIRIDWTRNRDCTKFLCAMFEPDDLLFIGERHDSGIPGSTIRSAVEWIKYFENGGRTAPFIIVNPLTGTPAAKKSGDGETYRGDGNIRTFKYTMAEFDGLNHGDQIAFWSSVKLPVVALVDTGGKSIHAWLDVSRIASVKSALDWEKEIKGRLYDQGLTPLGVDTACSNAARLARFPGHMRRETNKYQRILWLDNREEYERRT